MNKLLLILLLAGVAQLGAMEGPGGKEEMPLQAEAAQPGQDVFEFEKLPNEMQFAILEQTENLDDKIALLKVLQSSAKRRFAALDNQNIQFGKETYKTHDEFVKGLAGKIKEAKQMKAKLGQDLWETIKKRSMKPEEIIKEVKELIAKGASMDERRFSNWTLLHYAVKAYKPDGKNSYYGEIIKILLDNKADLNAREGQGGGTPLHSAVEEGEIKPLKILLDYKADPNTPTEHGETPLHAAAYKDRLESAKILLDYNANPNAQDSNGVTPLHAAVNQGRLDLVRVLLSGGADPTMKNKAGESPIDLAFKKGHKDILNALEYRIKPLSTPPTSEALKNIQDKREEIKKLEDLLRQESSSVIQKTYGNRLEKLKKELELLEWEK